MTIQNKPEHSTWTDDQWRAITVNGHHLLVAAAAGSGKTAVLVERIIRKITDLENPVDVDRLLVATFTKAAADEMRQRIREALELELEKGSNVKHLRRQIALIQRASITTLHSFCLDMVREHIHLLEIDPNFRIANETEAQLLRRETMEEMFEDLYARKEEDDPFWRLVDSYSTERSDEALYQLVEQIYDYSRSHPMPKHWLKNMVMKFDQKQDDAVREWIDSLIQDVQLQLQQAVDLLNEAIHICDLPGGPQPYAEQFRQEREVLLLWMNVSKTGDWSALRQNIQTDPFNRLKACRGEEFVKELQEKAKGFRDKAKDTVKKLKGQLFYRTIEEFKEELIALAPLMHSLIDIVLEFDKRFTNVKLEKGLVDFNDLEHYCLKILTEPSASGECIPSAIAKEYQSRYEEVLLDEYQDTNQVQETILNFISRTKPGNRFMVGDVKQSIYRFRLAEPSLFLEKYKTYASRNEHDQVQAMDLSQGERIDLSRNFRSRKEVLDAVNFVFRQLMNEGIGEIGYDRQAELRCGADYPEPMEDEYAVEVVVAQRDQPMEEKEADNAEKDSESGSNENANESSVELETAQLEAQLMAMYIRKMVGEDGHTPFMVYDRKLKGKRAATYRDVVILMRATQNWSPIIMEEFRKAGIPCYSDLNTGYFSAGEIELMLSLLKIIDNPYQDIPLAAVLRSPIYQLDAEALAQLRIHYPQGPLFEAVMKYSRTAHPQSVTLQDAVREFVNDLEQWREESKTCTVSELIRNIYRKTGFYDMVGGFPGGMQRQANLRALFDRSKQYESTSFRGLFRFLRFIEKMLDTGGDLGTARALGEQEDVVRIMSIHKSKGLEFPIVFVAGMNKQFNQQDLNGSFIMHKELGFGPKYVDPSLRISYPTLPHLAIKRKLRWEMLAEEMRILYVALTRAKEKLILTATVYGLERHMEKWSAALRNSKWRLPDGLLADAQTYMDWLGAALMRHPQGWHKIYRNEEKRSATVLEDDSKWKLHIVDSRSIAQAAAAAEARTETLRESLQASEPLSHMASQMKEKVGELLSWQDPHRQASELFSKTSVTELKRMAELKEATWEGDVIEWDEHQGIVQSKSQERFLLRRPKFKEKQKMTPVERGILYHSVMQQLPVSGEMTLEKIDQTIERMIEQQMMTREQSDQLKKPQILTFFHSDVGKRMLKSPNIYRELPFSYVLQAKEVYPHVDSQIDNEPVLIQGVVDCLFEEEAGFVLVDYKTDSVSASGIRAVKERYRIQMQLYRRALQDILNRPIADVFLYLFDTGDIVRMQD